MTQHYTRNTISAAFWCGKCSRHTQHRVDGGRKGPCLECIAKLEAEHAKTAKPVLEEKQQELFRGVV